MTAIVAVISLFDKPINLYNFVLAAIVAVIYQFYKYAK